MAKNNFDLKSNFKVPNVKAPTFGGGGSDQSNPFVMWMQKQVYDQQVEKQKADAARLAGGVPTEIKADGTTFNMPGARTATADAQNQLTRLKQLRVVANELQSLGSSLPTDYLSALKGVAGAKYAHGRFGSEQHKTYMDALPAASVGLYRAITGDNRLSDADAAARAKPLLWDPMEPEGVREGKNSFLNFMLDEAERNITPDQGEPSNDLDSLMRWQAFVSSSKQKFQQNSGESVGSQINPNQGMMQNEDPKTNFLRRKGLIK